MNVDLNAKRVTEKKGRIIESKEVIEFNKKYPEHKRQKKEDILKIARCFNNKMIEETQRNIYGVALPQNLGVVSIVNKGISEKRPIDFKASMLAGKIVRHRNWETDNNIMNIRFSLVVKGLQPKFMTIYNFEPMRNFRKSASAYFKKNWQRCVIITKKI